MHPLPLVVFLTLAAGPDRTIPVGCREDYGTCREDCTIDYGGSTTKYRQLSQCLERCANEQSECTTRHYTLRDANIDPLPAREADPAMRESKTYDDDLRDDIDTARPASGTRASDGVRRGVYRAAEEAPPARTEPAVMKEPEPESEPESEPGPARTPAAPAKRAPEPASAKNDDIRVFDDSEEEPEPAPAPKPAPKPAEPLRPTPPPEPKKKDISEWDPNGD